MPLTLVYMYVLSILHVVHTQSTKIITVATLLRVSRISRSYNTVPLSSRRRGSTVYSCKQISIAHKTTILRIIRRNCCFQTDYINLKYRNLLSNDTFYDNTSLTSLTKLLKSNLKTKRCFFNCQVLSYLFLSVKQSNEHVKRMSRTNASDTLCVEECVS